MGQQITTLKKKGGGGVCGVCKKYKTRKLARESRKWKRVKEVISNHSGFIIM